MRVKICGFTRESDVRSAVEAGADALGFNLARGPRRITPERAAQLAVLVPPFVQAVALFVDAGEEEILDALLTSRCTAVQLHGDEPPELAASLRRRLPVIKAFRIAGPADIERIRGYPADAFLLDASVPGAHGGTGMAWDHTLLAGRDFGAPVILAGGLTPANVAAAVAIAKPYGVDTASGVESAPGIKDAESMRNFVQAARTSR